MTVEEFYNQIGEDYQQVLGRMMNNEKFVIKFLKKFCEDSTYSKLAEAVSKCDIQSIFSMAHTLKGLAGNLGLKPLYETSAELTELTRHGESEGVQEIFETLRTEYDKIIQKIDVIE